jgi:hypothetical protein
MLGSLSPAGSESRGPTAADELMSVEAIDATRYLDDMDHTLRSSHDVGMRNEALAILRRWQFDDLLTDAAGARAAGVLREFTEIVHLSR